MHLGTWRKCFICFARCIFSRYINQRKWEWILPILYLLSYVFFLNIWTFEISCPFSCIGVKCKDGITSISRLSLSLFEICTPITVWLQFLLTGMYIPFIDPDPRFPSQKQDFVFIAALLRSCVGAFICSVCFVIICFSFLLFSITKTYLYNFDPLESHFYIVKLGFTGYTLFFLFLLKNIDCGYSLERPHRGGSNEYPQSMFWAEIRKNIRIFIWKLSAFGGAIFNIFE